MMLKQIVAVPESLVCIPSHLCCVPMRLADVLLSLILRLPPTEKKNFAPATQKKNRGILDSIYLHWVPEIGVQLERFQRTFTVSVLLILHHSLVLPVCCIIQRKKKLKAQM